MRSFPRGTIINIKKNSRPEGRCMEAYFFYGYDFRYYYYGYDFRYYYYGK